MKKKTTLTLALAALPVLAAAQAESEVALARAALDTYYETQRTKAKEEADWRLAESVLRSRTEVLAGQIAELKTKTEEEEAKITEADEDRSELAEKLAELDGVFDLQRERIGGLETMARRLASLAPPVSGFKEKLDSATALLPDVGAKEEEITASVGQRYSSVLAVLKLLTDFNRSIHLSTENRKTATGEIEARVLYLGLGQAFYGGGPAEDPVGGIGSPSEYGWQWEEKPEYAREILTMIDLFEGEGLARFVKVPVNLK